MSCRIVFTGGGTAGHVSPNLALIEAAQDKGWHAEYIGSSGGIEKDMVGHAGVSFHTVASGKLRRYFSWENFVDPFRIVVGIVQAFFLLGRLKPNLVFSKGGFVAVPVVVAAWLRGIPVVSHESDVTPGLANRLCYPFSRSICVTFAASRQYLPEEKVLLTGTPVRSGILQGDADRGLSYLGLSGDKPLLLVFGGSMGAEAINNAVRDALPNLLLRYDIVHVAGRGNLDSSLDQTGYVQKEFVADEFGDVLAAADLVISRAGANSLYELFVLRKPHLLIPLTLAASRGDQLVNARTFAAEGYSRVLYEEDLENESLTQAVNSLDESADEIKANLSTFPTTNGVDLILSEIEQIIA